MIVTCNKCQKEFDDKYYIQNNNKFGFEENLLSHIKQHEIHTKLGEWFTNNQHTDEAEGNKSC